MTLAGNPSLALAASSEPAEPASWTTLRTAHFTLYSHVDGAATQTIAMKLETFRTVLQRVTEGLRVKSSVPTIVFVFRNAEDFDPYKGDRRGESRGSLAGYFQQGVESNFIAIDAGSGDEPWHVVYHEYVHQVLSQSLARAPLWLHEGMAELYSTFTCEKATAEIGRPVREHVQWLHTHDLIPLDDLFSIRTDSPDYNEAGRVGSFYAQSWALAHYLLKGSAARSGQLSRFLRMLERGEDMDEAFRKAFDTSYAALEKELQEYVKNDSFTYSQVDLVEMRVPEPKTPQPVAPAKVLTQLGSLLARLGEGSAGDAEEHFKRALSYDPNDAGAMAGLATLMRRQKRSDSAAELLDEAQALAPSDTNVLLAKAKSLLQRATGVEDGRFKIPKEPSPDALRARDLLKTVLEAEPDNVEANVVLGMACLLGADELQVGVAAIEKALRLAPMRPDIAFDLLQLYGRQGDREKATVLVEKHLRRTGSPQMLQAAHEILLTMDLQRVDELVQQRKYREALEIVRGVLAATQNDDLRKQLEQQVPQLEAAAKLSR